MATGSIKTILGQYKELTVTNITNDYFELNASGQSARAWQVGNVILLALRNKNSKGAVGGLSDFVNMGKITGYTGTISDEVSMTSPGQGNSFYHGAFKVDPSGNIGFYTTKSSSDKIPVGVWFRCELVVPLYFPNS